jgi:hypothetical protein
MASQEEFELSRLLDHRLPADDARAGATILRGVHISTTDQASGPAEAEFAQRSSSDDPGSSHITQNASVITSSSNDNLPLSPKEDEDVRTTRVKQRATVPWPLRRGPLLGLVAYLVALITALEVVYFLSNRNQGLVTTKQDTSYLWKYLPTASKWNMVQRDHIRFELSEELQCWIYLLHRQPLVLVTPYRRCRLLEYLISSGLLDVTLVVRSLVISIHHVTFSVVELLLSR